MARALVMDCLAGGGGRAIRDSSGARASEKSAQASASLSRLTARSDGLSPSKRKRYFRSNVGSLARSSAT